MNYMGEGFNFEACVISICYFEINAPFVVMVSLWFGENVIRGHPSSSGFIYFAIHEAK